MRFDDAFQWIRHAFAAGRLAHAYLVAGAVRGAGQSFAERVGQLLLCGEAEPPCGACETCRKAAEHKAADMLWLEPEKKSRVFSVEVMRETVIPWASQTSFAGGWKILVLGFADRFNPNSGNAFLKTLEEPPPQTLFLLLSDQPDNLLPTLQSRCHRIDLTQGREPPADPWRSETGRILARHDAKTDVGVLATASRFEALLEAVVEAAVESVREEDAESDLNEEKDTLLAREGAKTRELRMAVLVAMQDWYRDLLVLTGGAAAQPLHFEEHRAELERRARGLPIRQAIAAIGGVEALARQLNDRHMPPASVFAYWMGRLA